MIHTSLGLRRRDRINSRFGICAWQSLTPEFTGCVAVRCNDGLGNTTEKDMSTEQRLYTVSINMIPDFFDKYPGAKMVAILYVQSDSESRAKSIALDGCKGKKGSGRTAKIGTVNYCRLATPSEILKVEAIEQGA